MEIWCSFGNEVPLDSWFWLEFQFANDQARHAGAPIGQRPLYYHVYSEDGYYYVQYWYWLNFNDIRNQTQNSVWHQGDWEHITIQLNHEQGTSNFTPDKVNLYQHEGGHTKNVTEGKWSSNHNSVSNVQTGYSSTYEHPVIFIASNSHASYFYGDPVYKFVLDVPGSSWDDNFIDEVNYDLGGNVTLFEYDYLTKLGEYKILYGTSAHGYSYYRHTKILGNSKEWLGFPGRVGKSWQFRVTDLQSFGLHFVLSILAISEVLGYDVEDIHVQTPAPFTPSFSWEYYSFTNDISGFGNESDNRKTITWESIWP